MESALVLVSAKSPLVHKGKQGLPELEDTCLLGGLFEGDGGNCNPADGVSTSGSAGLYGFATEEARPYYWAQALGGTRSEVLLEHGLPITQGLLKLWSPGGFCRVFVRLQAQNLMARDQKLMARARI